MSCEQMRLLISADVDGEIDQRERVDLDRHLAGCDSCRDYATGVRAQDAALRRAFAEPRDAATGVAERVTNQWAAERARGNHDPGAAGADLVLRPFTEPAAISPRRALWAPMLLSAAAGFLLAVLIFRPWQRPATELTEKGARPPHGQTETPDALAHRKDAPGSQRDGANSPGPTDGKTQLVRQDPPIPSPVATAQLMVAIGIVEMLPPGSDTWQPLDTRGTIAAGTRVRTPAESRCELRTADQSEVRMNVDTELLFESSRKLELARGQMWSNVAAGDNPYEVHIATADATVTALGTQFDIECKEDGAVLTVAEGATRVAGKAGDTRVNAREMARIVRGEVEAKHRVANLAAATSWVHEILKLKGGRHPELAQRMDELFAQIGEGKMTYLSEKEIIDLGDHCVLPLTRFIQSERSRDNSVRRVTAARILSKIAQPWAIPQLIELLADRDGGVRLHAAAALERVSGGERHGMSPDDWAKAADARRQEAIDAWQTWWEQNRAKFPPNPVEG